jgi:hypothetical protein
MYPSSITINDFNEDGKADLAVTNLGSHTLSVLSGTGTGSFGQAVNYGYGANPLFVSNADYTNDGHVDIVVTLNLTFMVSVLKGSGTGVFTGGLSYPVGSTPEAVTSADFNQDGNADLAVANYGSSNISVIFGNGTGGFSPPVNYTVGLHPDMIVNDDFNGDGNADLAVTISGSVSVLLGSSNGTFAPAVSYTTGVNTTSGLTSADFNGDGNIDLAATIYTPNSVKILFGDGLGSFTLGANYTAGTNPGAVISRDFNNDGVADLAVTNFDSNDISILSGSGTGTFGAPTNYTVGAGPASVTAADFNMDGFSDLVVSHLNTANIYVLLSNGTGGFSPSVAYYLGNASFSVFVADFNGDNFADIGATGYSEDHVSIFAGNGTGTFVLMPHYISGHYPYGGCVADFNNDGHPDIAVATEEDNVTVLMNGIPPVITTSANTVCEGSTATISVSGADTYSWSTGATGASISVNPAVLTSYTVTGTTFAGCSGTAVLTVTVNPLPTVSVTSGTICAGSSFVMVPGGAVTYSYSGGSATVSPIADTDYTVTGTDTNGCEDTAVSSVAVNALPVLTTFSDDSVICSGQSATLSVTGADTYTWSTNENAASIVVTPTVQTTYTVIGTDTNGCAGTAVSLVIVNALPVLIASSDNPVICSGQSATLSVAGADTYTWSTNENAATIVVTPTVQTTYTVVGTDTNGCSDSTTVIQDVSLCTNLSQLSNAANELTVYPNPSNGLFHLEIAGDRNIVVTGVLGTTVYNQDFKSGTCEIDLSHVANGVYLLKVQGNNGSLTTKQIIKK